MITYKVIVGAYVVRIRLLNVNDDIKDRPYERTINSGAFGTIILSRLADSEFVSKRFSFIRNLELLPCTSTSEGWTLKANFSDIETVLEEFAIAKICSVFGVGPKIVNPYGFDIVCYRNCIEFCMERCLPWKAEYDNCTKMIMEKRLKHCMKVMHLLRLVHRDIKPSNIVFSPSVNDYVFCDFGISHPIA